MNQSTIDLATVNTTNRDQSDRDLTLAKFEIAILSVIFILIVLGNGAVIVALISARVKIQRMYFYILHLSISDLVTAFFNVLPQLIWEISINFYGNNFLCKFVKYVQLLGPYLSSYVLVVTAIDRYQAICFPLANCTWTEQRAKIMISIAWIISLICCVPQAFIFSYVQIATTTYPNRTSSFKVNKEPVPETEEDTKYYFECWGTFYPPYEKVYVLWYATSVFFVPLVVLVFTYFNICKVIWINARLGRTNKSAEKGRKLIFYSKMAASLSRQRTGRRNEVNNISISRLRTKLPNESKENTNKFKQTPDQTISNYPSMTVQSSRCCRAQNGQITSSTNNEISLPTTNDKQTVTQTEPVSIFESRTAAQSTKLSKAKIKTIKVTIVVIICYISCSLPFCSVQIWAQFWPNAQSSSLWTGPLITITMLLPNLNSCVNPWIYLLLNRNLLYTLLKLLFGTKCIKNEAKYTNETTNQRLSVSMHKTFQPIDLSTNKNSPTIHRLANSKSPTVNSSQRKSRLKRLNSNRSMRSGQTEMKASSCDRLHRNSYENYDSHKNSTKIDTIASLNLLNKINVEKCTQMQMNNFNLPRVSSVTLTHKDQRYQASSSEPDLKSVIK